MSREDNLSPPAGAGGGAGGSGISKPGHSPRAGRAPRTSPSRDGRCGPPARRGPRSPYAPLLPSRCVTVPCAALAQFSGYGRIFRALPFLFQARELSPCARPANGSCEPARRGRGDRDRRTSAASPGRSRALLIRNSALTTVSIKRFQGRREKPQDTAPLGVLLPPAGSTKRSGLAMGARIPSASRPQPVHRGLVCCPRAGSPAWSRTSARCSREHPGNDSRSRGGGVPKKLQPLPRAMPRAAPPPPGAGQGGVSSQHVN